MNAIAAFCFQHMLEGGPDSRFCANWETSGQSNILSFVWSQIAQIHELGPPSSADLEKGVDPGNIIPREKLSLACYTPIAFI